jgi:L-lactate dehydrogenase complex protein LldG
VNAREAILAAIGTAYGPGPRPEVTVPRDYRRVGEPADPGALVDQFVERVEDYHATVVRCAPADLRHEVILALSGAAPVVVPDGLDLDIPAGVSGDALSHAELDAADAVVTLATVAIASTGTIVLTHGPGQGRRALTLVPDLHVCVVHVDQVVADVPDTIARLEPSLPQTWISGPSATSDIELSRVEGVHGPRTLHVVLVEPAR